MKLTIVECQAIIDSRLVDLERAIKNYKDNEPIVDDSKNLDNIQTILDNAHDLYEAYENKIDAEEEAVIEDYKINFLGE